jgi:RecA-family ATPase
MKTRTQSQKPERAFRDLADAYLDAGHYPIPIRPARKKPHIERWGKVMSADLVGSWKKRFPNAGLGLVLGKPVNDNLHLVALDIDQDELVEPVKKLLFPANDDVKSLYVAKRGKRGETIFAVSEEQLPGRKFKNSAGMGVEVLADGQQTVIPPTNHLDGMPYEWIGECELLDADLTQLPKIDQETVNQLEVLVKGTGTAQVANDNSDYYDWIGYLGGGEYTGVDMFYPGNVNDTQCKMAAVAAHHDYMTGNTGKEARLTAAQGMAAAAFDAYQLSGSNEEWSHDEQLEEALSQYDSAMAKGLEEWGWAEPTSNDQPAKPEVSTSLKLVSPASWVGQEIPERIWVVKDLVPLGVVTSLYGDGGMGKTQIAQQLMTACAVGSPWLGMDVRPGRSIGLFCEDDMEELMRRQERINQHYGVELGDLEAMLLTGRFGEDNLLMNFNSGDLGTNTPLFRNLLNRALEFKPELIVIDTLADTFGGNENDRGHVRRFIANTLGQLAKETGAAVLLCAHPSKSGQSKGTGESGSTGWNNSVRSRLYLKKDSDGDFDLLEPRTLSRMKANYAPSAGEDIRLIWEDGVFVPIGPIDPGDIQRRERQVEQEFLNMFDQLTEKEITMAESNRSPNYAPKVMLKNMTWTDCTAKELEDAMANLIRDGKIEMKKKGPPSQRKQYLVRVSREDQGNEAA